MKVTSQASSFYIGWDVGGWNCDKNGKSRDALVIFDAGLNLVGKPWRGNLRSTINDAADSADWIGRLFALCKTAAPSDARITLAIDTPLGLSEAFVRLVTQQGAAGEIGRSDTNPYLFRQTERFLFERGLKPLSAIKDMIGSQATKGMHALARFAPHVLRCGVWSDGVHLTAIEAYPSPCLDSALVQQLLKRYLVAERAETGERLWSDGIDHADKLDALTCALIAHVFRSKPDALSLPPEGTPLREGWIWVPKDVLRSVANRRVLIE